MSRSSKLAQSPQTSILSGRKVCMCVAAVLRFPDGPASGVFLLDKE